MKARSTSLATAAALLLPGCMSTPVPPVYQGEFGVEKTYSGLLRLGFERQSLDECFLEFRSSAMADLGRLAPSPALNDPNSTYSAEVTLVGRRRDMVGLGGEAPVGYGFGHLSMYPCLVEANRITAARIP